MASPSQRGQMDLSLLILPGTTSLDVQIFSFDDDLELKSANYHLWAKSDPRPVFICPAERCQKKQGKMCTSVSPVAKPSISIGGEPSGVYKERHDS